MQKNKKWTWRDYITIGVGLAVVMNMVTLIWIYRLDKHLDIPVSVNTSCSGYSSRYIIDYLEGIDYSILDVGSELDEKGRLIQGIEFTLSEKIPQSKVLFHYQEVLEDGTKSEWKIVSPTIIEGETLKYALELRPDYKKHRILYQVVQQLNGETVKASSIQRLDVDYEKGDVNFRYRQYLNETEITFLAVCSRNTPIEAYQVEEVQFTIFKGAKKEEYIGVVTDRENEYECEVDDRDQIDRVRITAVYKDGETRTAEFKSPYNQSNPLFTR